MQLKLQRSQRLGGVLGNTVVFCLDVRAEYARDEALNIAKYRLGQEVIYNSRAAERHLDKAGAKLDRAADTGGGLKGQMSGLVGGVYSLAMAKMNLNISIASLGRGHHVECKDLTELMEAEEAVMQACRNLRDYLKLAATFNGSTIVVDFSTEEEQVHTAMGREVYAPPPALPAAEPPRLQIVDASPAPDRTETQAIAAAYEEQPRFPPGTVGAEFGSGEVLAVMIKNSINEKWPELAATHSANALPFQLGASLLVIGALWWTLGFTAAFVTVCIALPLAVGYLLLRR